MPTTVEKFIGALKDYAEERNALNNAFHGLFYKAGIIGLDLNDKIACIDAIKDYAYFDDKYDNVHIHWSS